MLVIEGIDASLPCKQGIGIDPWKTLFLSTFLVAQLNFLEG
jgi:hypothetical protein